jgi:hypothetical protein
MQFPPQFPGFAASNDNSPIQTHQSACRPRTRAHQELLAQPNKRARPMARLPLNINNVTTHLSRMS